MCQSHKRGAFLRQNGGLETLRLAIRALRLIAEGKLDTEPLITHTYPLSRIEEAYELFENRRDNVIKVAVECS